MTAKSSRTGARSAEFLVKLHHEIATICPTADLIASHLCLRRVHPCRFVPQTSDPAFIGTDLLRLRTPPPEPLFSLP